MAQKIILDLKEGAMLLKQDLLRFTYKYLEAIGLITIYLIVVALVYGICCFMRYPVNLLALWGYSAYPGIFLIGFIYVVIETPLKEKLKDYKPQKKLIANSEPNPFKEKHSITTLVANKTFRKTTGTVTKTIEKSHEIKRIEKPIEKIVPPITIPKVLPKLDYVELTKRRQEIGLAGELFVIKIVKLELIRNGLHDLANKVEQVSLTNDSLGYDIISYDINGKKIFIEVKSTTDNRQTPFYLTDTEFENLKLADNYFIYRVFDLNIQTGNANYQIIDCKSDFQNKYKFQPASYKVSPLPL